MPVKIKGSPPEIRRVVTGLHSFDRAFENADGEIGLPCHGVELYGPSHCGKSTITYGLSGIVAEILGENIGLVDFEGFSPKYVKTMLENSGFDGTLEYIAKADDEEALNKLAEVLRDDYCVGILDSIGAISTIAEAQGEIGPHYIGGRARIMAQFSRRIIKMYRNRKTRNMVIFLINHVYPKVGGRGKVTPGGEVKNFLASMRLEVKRKWRKGKYAEYPDGSYIIEGKVVKNRWGYKDRTFHLFVLAGAGIHRGLTALYDGVALGLVDYSKTIKIGSESFGYMKNVVMEAHKGNDEFFQPFFDILHLNTVPLEDLEKEDEETEDDRD